MTNLIFCCLLFSIGFCSCKNLPPSQTEKAQTSMDDYDLYLENLKIKWEGQTAPNFTLQDINKQPHELSAYRGDVILLNFWHKDCKPCITEIPSIKELQKKYQSKGLIILSITKDATKDIEQLILDKKINYSVLVSGEQVAKDYEIKVYPTNILINPQGTIEKIFTGASDWDATHTYLEIKPYLEKLLNE